ncbi:MAG: hypothetical protein K9H64_01155 [Bacteroidales bacterium]|nr:hypothetical protein [Bacteroidales bacterium]MCF8454739.1 hypothetical protein [Bacteroidales bacterium]
MKTKCFLILALLFIGIMGYSQTDLLYYYNLLNVRYHVYIVYEENGNTYQDNFNIEPYPAAGSDGIYSGGITTGAELIEFRIEPTTCAGPWVTFMGGTADFLQIEDCSQCASGDAMAGYDGYVGNPSGVVGIRCKP